MRNRIKDIPFLILSINALLLILSLFWKWDWLYWLMPQISGHGLLLIGYMAFYAYVHRYCLYSWICIAGLGLLNVLNIAYYFLIFGYYQFYAGVIIFTCLTFAIVKWRQFYYKQNPG